MSKVEREVNKNGLSIICFIISLQCMSFSFQGLYRFWLLFKNICWDYPKCIQDCQLPTRSCRAIVLELDVWNVFARSLVVCWKSCMPNPMSWQALYLYVYCILNLAHFSSIFSCFRLKQPSPNVYGNSHSGCTDQGHPKWRLLLLVERIHSVLRPSWPAYGHLFRLTRAA